MKKRQSIIKTVLVVALLAALTACSNMSTDPCHDCDDKNQPHAKLLNGLKR